MKHSIRPCAPRQTRLHPAPIAVACLVAGFIAVTVGCRQPPAQPINQPPAQPTNQPADQPTDQPTRARNGLPTGPDFLDSNGNGIDDAIDISYGTSLDENLNGTPDESETDGAR